MDALLLSRLQFALTIGFHFLFPPITIGLGWLLVIMEGIGWRKKDELYVRMGKFFAKLFALTFAVGVATGIVMEFQFGTNWSTYSKFVGDIFGAPLAAEGVFAFFLESGFLGLYLFGRNKVSKGVHWFSCLMVAVGATISAFWIIVANSWQQTPAGYIVRNGRAELTSFFDAVFNPSTVIRYLHTLDASLIAGAFFVAGIAAYLFLKGKEKPLAQRAMNIALVFGFVVSVLELMPFGHEHARQVARTQEEKFAAIEGMYISQSGAPLVFFAVPFTRPPELKAKVEMPGLLSWMAFGDVNAHIKGINEFPVYLVYSVAACSVSARMDHDRSGAAAVDRLPLAENGGSVLAECHCGRDLVFTAPLRRYLFADWNSVCLCTGAGSEARPATVESVGGERWI
jgi:cytochrome d ubiquinol oxidase subunit I